MLQHYENCSGTAKRTIAINEDEQRIATCLKFKTKGWRSKSIDLCQAQTIHSNLAVDLQLLLTACLCNNYDGVTDAALQSC